MTVKTIGIKIAVILLFVGNLYAQDKNTGLTDQNTITVYGIGTVSVQPDVIQIDISLSKSDKTTRLAQQEVSRMVRKVLEILKENNIEDKNINTASLRFKPEYDYKLGKRVITGQRAEQRITFSIDGINNDDERVSKIIDSLTQINGLELNQISYNVKNNAEYDNKSRELAFRNASEKANQYAELSGRKIAKVLSISEDGTQRNLPTSNRAIQLAGKGFSPEAADSSTMLPLGEMEITTRILIVFLLE